MDKEDGRKIPREALEERRKVVVRMWKAKCKVPDIIAATGASYTSIYLIWRQYQENGKKSIAVRLRGHKHGDGRHLTPEQELQIQSRSSTSIPISASWILHFGHVGITEQIYFSLKLPA